MKTTTMIHHSETKPTNAVRSRLAMLIVTLALTTASVTGYGAAIAHWTFDESSGTVANDSVGSFNGNLSATGSAFVSGGISGNAISLNRAANGFVNMGNVLGLTSGSFSFVVWVKTSSSQADTVAFGKHQTFSHNGYLLAINPTGGGGLANKAMFYEGSIVNAPLSTTSVNDGNWHQIVCVYQAGGSKSIYVDGAPAESTKTSEIFSANSAPFLIGGTGVVPEGRYSGLIDDLQVYSQALSGADVNFLFNNPGKIVLDCSEQLAAVQSQLAAANATNAVLKAQLAAANANNAALQGQLAASQIQLATANITIATLQSQLAGANQNIQNLQNENLGLLLPLQVLTEEYRVAFKDPGFEIRGASSVEQMENFVNEVLNLPRGQQQNLFIKLGDKK